MSLGLNSNIQPQMQYGIQQQTSYQMPQMQPQAQSYAAAPYKEMQYQKPQAMPGFSPQMSPAAQIQALQTNQLKQLEELNKISAQNTYGTYGTQYNLADTNTNTEAPDIQNALQNTQIQDAQNPTSQNIEGQNPAAQNLDIQNPADQNPAAQTSDIQMDETLKNALHAPFDSSMNESSLNAQMPAPEIKNGKGPVQNKEQNMEQNGMQNGEAGTALENNKQNKNYKELPHLNVGVVDGPSKHSKTPVTDSLNRKSIEKPKTKLPAASNKKSFTAGSLSNLCALGAFGIVSVLFAPKGISKILKLIKHK